MSDLFIWWLTIELLGLIGLPITLALFRRLPDRGYAFGKALAILLVCYVLWLSASLHILPNTRWAIMLVAALMAGTSVLVFIRRRRDIVAFFSGNIGTVVATEVIFFLAFLLWVIVRAYNPELIYTEKLMDFAFVNGILRSEYFPPLDPWLSGYHLNNYYFGHMIIAALTRLTGVPPAVAFNLSIAVVFGLGAIGAFGIVYNLVKLGHGATKAAIGFGVVGACFLVIVGNLEGVLEIFNAHGFGSQDFWAWLGIDGLGNPYHSEHWYPTQYWWWWHATRMIQTVVNNVWLDYTIAEFPIFSFVLGDLHAHLLSLPFVLLCVGICLNIVAMEEVVGLDWLRRNSFPFLAMVVCIGALGPIHTWDLPVYLFLFIGTMLVQNRLRQGAGWWKGWAALSLVTIICAILLYLPFYLNLQNPVSGVLPWVGPGSRWIYLLLMWGLFLVIAVSFVLLQGRGIVKLVSWRTLCLACGAVMALWVIWAIIAVAIGGDISIWGRLAHVLPFLVLLAAILIVGIRRTGAGGNGEPAAIFALLLFFAAVLLITGCELFYIRDVFGNRMNTVFRFYFQAWVLFAVASAFALYYIHRRWKAKSVTALCGKYCWWVLVIILVMSSLVYSVAAVWSKTGSFSGSATLDGMAWQQLSHPAEYEAVMWLNYNATGALVIVTAPGYQYTDHGIISAYTGLPSVLGWEGHEYVWRASDRDYRGRREDIAQIYTGVDINQVQALLDKYNVTYVYMGRLEREMYGTDVGSQLGELMDIAFENEDVIIYQVKK